MLEFGFGRDVPLQNLKVHSYTKFSRKSDPFIYLSAQFWAKSYSKSPNFSKMLTQIWRNFENGFIYIFRHIPNFAFVRCHSYTKRLILLPILAAHYLMFIPQGSDASWDIGKNQLLKQYIRMVCILKLYCQNLHWIFTLLLLLLP